MKWIIYTASNKQTFLYQNIRMKSYSVTSTHILFTQNILNVDIVYNLNTAENPSILVISILNIFCQQFFILTWSNSCFDDPASTQAIIAINLAVS